VDRWLIIDEVRSVDDVRAKPVLVVVTGVPGAGKTTLGSAIARVLEVPFVSLDAIKETLYAQDPGPRDPFELRLAAEAVLSSLLDAGPGMVVVDIWIAPNRDSSRVAALLREQRRDIVELLCRVPADVAIGRYTSRRRSAPHRSADASMLARIRRATTEFEPLGIGRCIEVDTSQPVDIGDLVDRIHDL
jgi:predicted kinase